MFLRYYTQALHHALGEGAGFCLSPLLGPIYLGRICLNTRPRLYGQNLENENSSHLNSSDPVSCPTLQATLLSHSSFVGEALGPWNLPTGREEGGKMGFGVFSHFYLF